MLSKFYPKKTLMCSEGDNKLLGKCLLTLGYLFRHRCLLRVCFQAHTSDSILNYFSNVIPTPLLFRSCNFVEQIQSHRYCYKSLMVLYLFKCVLERNRMNGNGIEIHGTSSVRVQSLKKVLSCFGCIF